MLHMYGTSVTAGRGEAHLFILMRNLSLQLLWVIDPLRQVIEFANLQAWLLKDRKEVENEICRYQGKGVPEGAASAKG